MYVYLVTEKSDIFEDFQIIFEDYADAKAYVHDEIVKFRNFVEDHPVPVEIEPNYEELVARYEEPILDKKYIGTLLVSNKYWETQTPIATIEVIRRPLMSFRNGSVGSFESNIRKRVDYITYDGRRHCNE